MTDSLKLSLIKHAVLMFTLTSPVLAAWAGGVDKGVRA